MPRNEVADFILSDLDKAIDLLQDQGFAANNRINKQVAQLVKSRVALYEASFETYHDVYRVMKDGQELQFILTISLM